MGYRGPKTGEGGRPLSSRFGPKTRISVPEKLTSLISSLIVSLEADSNYDPETCDVIVRIEKIKSPHKTSRPKEKSPISKGFSPKKKNNNRNRTGA